MQGDRPVSGRRLASFLIIGALFGKFLGFVREIVMAHTIGVSFIADSFRAAISAVLLPLALFQSDIVPAIMIPLHRKWREEGRSADFYSLTAALLAISVMLTVVVEIFADQWVRVFVGGFSAEALDLTRRFVQVMALAMPASVLFNCLMSIELSLGFSRLTSIRSSVQNIGVVIGIIVMGYTGKPIAMAWGFTCAFNATVIWGTIMLFCAGELGLPTFNFNRTLQSFKTFLIYLRSMIAQPISEQCQIWAERFFASDTGQGSVAALDYARTLTDTALYVVSQPIGMAVLASHKSRNIDDLLIRLRSIACPLLIVSMPASLFLVIFASDLVQLIFARGAFGADGVSLTSAALMGSGAGLWAATLGMVLIRQLNGDRRNGMASLIIAQAYAVNIVFNFLFGRYSGTLGFGIGESLRGLVLLLGAAASIGCLRMIGDLIMRIMPSCITFGVASCFILLWCHEPLIRVFVGGCAYMAIVGLTIAIMIPSIPRWIITHQRKRII